MERRAGHTWLIDAFALFLLVLFCWIVLALWAGITFGAEFAFLQEIRSRILADYGPDIFGQTLKTLRVAIFGDLATNSDHSPEVLAALNSLLQDPVPSATLMPSQLSSTSVPTPTSTVTSSPTETIPLTPTGTTKPKATSTATTPSSRNNASTPTPTVAVVKPILECVEKIGDENFTAYFGYENTSASAVEVPIGVGNHFKPQPKDRGQPTTFRPGRTKPFPESEFTVTFSGGQLEWHLSGQVVVASGSSGECAPTPTPEPEPSPTPTPDPEPSPTPQDSQKPIPSGGVLNPPPGELSTCSTTIMISDLRVLDPPPSSGIKWVKLKYQVQEYSGYIYSDPLSLCGGGPTPEGGWDGCYTGSIKVKIDREWSSPAPDPFYILLWAKVRDFAGNTGLLSLGTYTMPAGCVDESD